MKITILTVSSVVILAFGLMSLTTTKDKYNNINKNNKFLQNPNAGKVVYTKVCSACHQPTGAGLPGVFPPLAKSDYLNADLNRAIKQVIKGSTGAIIVNGKKYNTPMPAQGTLSDNEIADVLTYVYASWGNTNTKITPAMVKAQRK